MDDVNLKLYLNDGRQIKKENIEKVILNGKEYKEFKWNQMFTHENVLGSDNDMSIILHDGEIINRKEFAKSDMHITYL